MAIDPHTGLETPPQDYINHRPLDPPEGRGLWLPLAIVAALFIVAMFFYADRTPNTPNVRADSGNMTNYQPSPN